ncbi:hypothetical protein PILCRDRAFT_23790, partial [Piloderma croceum F 1598]
KNDPSLETKRSYAHAMKLRAAMTYGFGHSEFCGSHPWHLADSGEWRGNPSVSDQVSNYMISLRKRKARSGEVAMSSRAITPDLMHKLYEWNHRAENWTIQPYTPGSRNPGVRL